MADDSPVGGPLVTQGEFARAMMRIFRNADWGWDEGRGSFTVPAALAPTIAKINENHERQRARMQQSIDTPVFGDAVLHDDHGPCAPLGPLSAEEVHRLMMQEADRETQRQAAYEAHMADAFGLTERRATLAQEWHSSFPNPYGDTPPAPADLRDEKIEALTTLVTEMGAIITEQRADIEALRDEMRLRLNALHQIVSNVGLATAVLGRNPNLDAAERRLMDDPTMRAMSSLRAKGLA